ncbi:Thioredoxin superfamily protein [Zea mays]|uniref:Thioredoxin superfamily protein n=2 Tax=Zea mays TaxID=4577 RepID=A0A1D6FQ47_MAIZE|nr:Thioredoxin superfamily protein [Zea mays]
MEQEGHDAATVSTVALADGDLSPEESRGVEKSGDCVVGSTMALHCSLPATCSTLWLRAAARPDPRFPRSRARLVGLALSGPRHRRLVHTGCARAGTSDSKAVELVLGGRARGDDGDTDSESSDEEDAQDRMTDEERRTLRRKIREMMDRVPETAELTDPEERRVKMRELLTKYELVVEEEDPDWPEDAEDGMGFSLGQFFDKITIKAEKKDDTEEDDVSGYQSDKEIVWEDDNYIRPVRDVRTQDWDASVFTDFGPMVVLVHNRYKRPQENETARAELTKAIEMFWEHNLPSPRV